MRCQQGNNSYIFPGIGLGHLASGSARITIHDMYVAATTLTYEQLCVGCLYPPLENIRDVSARIATALVVHAYQAGTATKKMPDGNLLEYVKSLMFDPFEDPFSGALGTKSTIAASTRRC